MPEDEALPVDTGDTGSEYHRRTVTTETVKRGDLYVPLADRFDKIERRVSFLSWVVIIDIILTVTTNPNIGLVELFRLIGKVVGA